MTIFAAAARSTGARLLRTLRLLTAAAVCLCAPGAARAEPFVGAGEATVAEFKNGTIDLARKRALRRARTEALEAALETLPGPVDKTARRTVLKSGDAWTGAYRIVSQSVAAGGVRIEIEADVDLARLAKRVMPRPSVSTAPMFKLGALRAQGCLADPQERVQTELQSVGALGTNEALAATIEVVCAELGVVPHTFVSAATARIRVRHGESVVAVADATGLGVGAEAAEVAAVALAAEVVGRALAEHRRGLLRVRVEAPLPAARVRRLERAMRDSIMGVVQTSVAGIEADGSVLLHVQGDLSAETLARALETLRLPGFSATIQSIDGPDALRIRLQ